MSSPLISIISTYNRPHLLPHAVQSALEQTIDDIAKIGTIYYTRARTARGFPSRLIPKEGKEGYAAQNSFCTCDASSDRFEINTWLLMRWLIA